MYPYTVVGSQSPSVAEYGTRRSRMVGVFGVLIVGTVGIVVSFVSIVVVGWGRKEGEDNVGGLYEQEEE